MALVLVPLAAAATACLDDGFEAREIDFDRHFLAPCCWLQTIDQHTSLVAIELRREVHDRLLAGEAPSAIEASLVQRYGERIKTAPPGTALSVILFAAAGLVGATPLFMMLVRKRRARNYPEFIATPPPAAASDEENDRLDDELSYVDA